jgi:hypothetical protein
MAMLFGNNTTKTPQAATQVLNGVRVTQSTYGNIIPVIVGPNALPMSLLGLFDFLTTTTTTPGQKVGKGIGGGGTTPSTTSTTYSTAFQALLGFGPIDHIDAVWDSAGKIPVQQIAVNFTVPGGGGHTDITDAGYQGDKGVGHVVAYSQTVNDFGSDGAVTLSGTYLQPFVVGSSTSAGVYTVTVPSAGVTRYTFSAADAGKTVTINYTTNFASVQLTREIVIPGGATYSVDDPTNYVGNSRVVYASSGNAFFGPGDHSIAQHYSADNSGNFTFATADIGQTVIITYQSKDPNSAATSTLNFSLTQGTASQTAWSYLTGKHQSAALDYPNLATVQSADLELGSTASMPQLSFEGVATKYMAGAGIAGANPADLIEAILTDNVWGIGLDPSLLGDWSNARNFWQANGFFVSLLQDTQDTAWNVIDQILEACQGVRFWNDGKLQIAVYGDTSAAGNGAIFEPDTQPVVEFSVDDMIASGGSEPVKVETEAENNIFNKVKIEFLNAANDYNTDVIMEDDPGSIQNFGLNEESQQSWHFIRSVQVAQLVANLRLKRMTNIRDKFTMTVTTRYRSLLVPMKLITVTWDAMGWNQKPLRVLSIDDSHSGLALTLEEFPYGVSKPTLYPKMTPQAINANPALKNPGDTDIVVLEIPDLMNGFAGRTIRIYANPLLPDNWGGCEVFTSDDNSFFVPRGQIVTPVVFGTLTSTLNVGTGDPDTQSLTMTVSNGLQLAQPPTSDFDNDLSLLAIIDVAGTVEIVAFKNVALTSTGTYTIDHFHRGLFGTTRASHVSGATIVEMGESFIEYTYPASRDGSDLFIKAASFNKMQGRLQDLGDLTSSSVVLTGDFPGFYDKASGTLSLGKTIDDTVSGRLARTAAHSTYRPTTNPLTAHDAGASATVNIAAFHMRVPGFSDISLNSGSITNLSYDTTYYIYYNDLSLAGGAVTYLSTTTKETAITSGSSFFVGSIRTPKAGAFDTKGFGDGGAGAHTGMVTRLLFSDIPTVVGAVSNPSNIIDGDPTTFGQLSASGISSLNNMEVIVQTVPGIARSFSSLTMNVIWSVPTNTLNGSGTRVTLTFIAGGVTAGTINTNAGTTVALRTDSFSIPQTMNPLSCEFTVQAFGTTGDSSGSLVVKVFDVWVEGTE